ncbi:MAG: hypothetical protein QOJ99_5931, partial [Bryobacterales bacterium]|nr:hypothetical protein [Bryobacterales bacterium]
QVLMLQHFAPFVRSLERGQILLGSFFQPDVCIHSILKTLNQRRTFVHTRLAEAQSNVAGQTHEKKRSHFSSRGRHAGTGGRLAAS